MDRETEEELNQFREELDQFRKEMRGQLLHIASEISPMFDGDITVRKSWYNTGAAFMPRYEMFLEVVEVGPERSPFLLGRKKRKLLMDVNSVLHRHLGGKKDTYATFYDKRIEDVSSGMLSYFSDRHRIDIEKRIKGY